MGEEVVEEPSSVGLPEAVDVPMETPEPSSVLPGEPMDVPMEAPESTAREPEKDEPSEEPTSAGAADLMDTGPLGGLSPEDLEALGLGGAAAWLDSFANNIEALKARSNEHVAGGAVDLLSRLVRNIVASPSEAKFRRIKADNAKIRDNLLAAGPEAERLITLLGFESVTQDDGRAFVL